MRITMIDAATATGKAKTLLDGVQAKLGVTPNLMRALAQSPAVLEGYLNFNSALSGGNLRARLREQIALAVAQVNQCGYCLAAHSALGKAAGLSREEIEASRGAASQDPKTAAALVFAQEVVLMRGSVSQAAFDRVRAAGYSDGEITEIVAHVALNVFTNYFNQAVQTEIDFPKVSLSLNAAA